MLTDLKAWINGVRHGRGFGVHSPWAFETITAVLRCDCAYYAYPDIDFLFDQCPGLARAVFRLLVHEQPSVTVVIGDDRWDKLVQMACPAKTAATRQPITAVIVDDPSKTTVAQLAKLTADGGLLIMTCLNTPAGFALWQQALADCPGMAIQTNRALGIINRRRDLPHQLIKARL